MQRIAFWTTLQGGGGSEVLWHATARKLVDGNRHVFCSLFRSQANGEFIKEMSSRGVAIVLKEPYPTLVQRVMRRAFGTNGSKPSAELLDFRPDAIIINSDSSAWVGDRTLVESLKALEVPYIVVIHGAGAFFEDDVRESARFLYSGAQKVCFVSSYTRGMVERHLAFRLVNAEIIRNPVNSSINPKRELAMPLMNGKVRFATVSRLNCYTKGHDYLLESFTDSSIGGRDFECRIYGDGPHKSYLRELIRYYGLEGCVEICGHEGNIEHVWRHAHVHVLPSITESAPIALVEAMMCGRPSIATRVGGVSEWLEDDVSGFIVENANPWNLVQGFRRCFDNLGRLQEMGASARARAMVMYGDPVVDFIRLVGC